jgi:fimbrial chaperone protein
MSRSLLGTLLFSVFVVFSTSSYAQTNPFEVSISPSRFEISGKSSNRIGQSLDIVNLARASTELSVRTLDWTYSDAGGATLVDELLPNSCRPWVTLERKTVKIGAGAKYPFRFQIDVPADAPRGECRFMLAIEGVEPAYKSLIQGGSSSLSLPVSGRIAVAVYVAINGAEPKLEVTQVASRVNEGTAGAKSTPILTVRNTGDAHGRLEGALDAVDAKGVAFELMPEGTPILPGQTRPIPLSQKTEPNQKPVDVTFPIKVTGSLDWEKGSFKVNAEFK